MKAGFYNGNQTITSGTCVLVPSKQDKVQIKVVYEGICGTDLHIYHDAMDKRIKMPQVIGHEINEGTGDYTSYILGNTSQSGGGMEPDYRQKMNKPLLD